MPGSTPRSQLPSSSSCTSWNLPGRCWRRYRNDAHSVPTTASLMLTRLSALPPPPQPAGPGQAWPQTSPQRLLQASTHPSQALEMSFCAVTAWPLDSPPVGTGPLTQRAEKIPTAFSHNGDRPLGLQPGRAEARCSPWLLVICQLFCSSYHTPVSPREEWARSWEPDGREKGEVYLFIYLFLGF